MLHGIPGSDREDHCCGDWEIHLDREHHDKLRARLTSPEEQALYQIAVRPARTMAVRRYSGTWSEANYDEHRAALFGALDKAGVTTIGPPVWARYNAPMTPWFMRRNEVMVEVSWPRADGAAGPERDG